MTSAIHSRRLDKPLEDDPIGNAIPGMFAGGIIAAGSAIGSGASHVAAHVGKHTAQHVAGEVIVHAVQHGPPHRGEGPRRSAASAPAPNNAAAAGAPVPSMAGRSGARAVSEAVPDVRDGGRTDAAPAGNDAIPYLPGKAPARIPEALPSPDVVVFSG